VLLGQPASEAFAEVCGIDGEFAAMLKAPGIMMTFGDLSVRRFVLPHPTAPYPGKSDLYGEAFRQIGQILGG
jgi:hypothetical protein